MPQLAGKTTLKRQKPSRSSFQFAIYQDETATCEDYISKQDAYFNDEAERSQRLMSLYTEHYEYYRGHSTTLQIQADEGKRMPARVQRDRQLRKWEDNVITETMLSDL